MSEFYHLLDEHLNILRDKGYQEKQLGNPDYEGRLFNVFRSMLSEAVNEALRFDYTTDFQIDVIGYFPGTLSNPVNIKLSYSFNPDKSHLNVDCIELEYEGNTKVIELKNNNDLPNSNEIPALIERKKQIRNRVFTRPIKASGFKRKG